MKKIILFTFSLLCITFTNAQFSEYNTNTNYNLYSVSAVNERVVWVAGATGALMVSWDGGTTWLDRTANTTIGSTDLYSIFAIDSLTALVTGSSASGAFIYRTTDAGVNWTTVFTQTGGFGDGFWMFDSLRGVFYGDPVDGKWSIWHTTDGGVSWDSTGTIVPPPGSAAGWNNAIWGDNQSVAIGTNNTQILWSTDFGQTWTSSTTTGQTNSFFILFTDTATGYVGGTTGLIKTTDMGGSWSPLTLPGTGSVSGITRRGGTLWVTRTGGSAADSAIHQSTDQGLTWTRAYTVMNGGSINHFKLAMDSSSVWAVTATGYVIKGLLGAPVGINDQEFTPNQFSLGQNYPNPFNPSTTIKYQIENSGFVSLKVFDALGREVATLVNENKVPGIYSVNFNALNLPSGIYMYQLKSGNFTDVKKMTFVK